MPKLPTAARAGVRKPSGKEPAGSRAPGTAQRYEDFAPAISAQAGSSWHLEHEKMRQGSAAGIVDQRRNLHAAASQSPERAQ